MILIGRVSKLRRIAQTLPTNEINATISVLCSDVITIASKNTSYNYKELNRTKHVKKKPSRLQLQDPTKQIRKKKKKK